MAHSNELFVDEEFTSEAMIDEPDANSQYAGAFFPNPRKFTVHGGIFTSNVTNNIHNAPTIPPDFRMIPLGDIDLQKEIQLDKMSGVVRRGSGRKLVRRMYTAKIDGKNSDMTVALYQGDNAEDEWKQCVSKVSGLRHPNIVQIYGTANFSGTYATIFHDDLVPLGHFVDLYRYSPILSVYIWACCEAEWDEADNYFESVSQLGWYSQDCTLWIRRSRRRLCADLARDDDTEQPYYFWQDPTISLTLGLLNLDQLNPEATAISSLTLEQYHNICNRHLKQMMELTISSQETVKLGSVIYYSASSEGQKLVEIAFLPEVEVDARFGWYAPGDEIASEIMANGWTRYKASDVGDRSFWRSVLLSIEQGGIWLGQANHIFSRLRIMSNYEDFVFVNNIDFRIQISPTPQPPPEGFLFLCPTENLQIGPNSFRWPDCPAHWTLDPSGVQRLSPREAANLGFPTIELKTTVCRYKWDASVYPGLRQFHQGKGFDPESQDVARHLGHQLYQPSENPDLPSAHVNDSNAESSDEEWFEVSSDDGKNSTQGEGSDEEIDGSSNNSNENIFSKSEEADIELLKIAGNGTADENPEFENRSDGELKGSIDGEPSERSTYILDQDFNFGVPATEAPSQEIVPSQDSTSNSLDSMEADPPGWSWIITMGVQLALILTLALFSLYEHIYPQPGVIN